MSDSDQRLADETSPYLRQHADNPVDWYPWGEQALQRARQQDRPIFLSVGYSACHWCHVMERESFENEDIARRLNDYFVNIKVDREERPAVDKIYMNAVQLMSGQGGWPMSVWLTPKLEPFYAGTYFPPHSRWGRPGFGEVIDEVHRAWTEDRDRVMSIADEITGHLEEMSEPGEGSDSLGREPIRAVSDALSKRFDSRHGGFSTAPKFPAAAQCRLLLRIATDQEIDEKQRRQAREMAETTLIHMASGGMYDHLGGGFHRYSTDARWLIPHFEKMLYDNALLMKAYGEAWQATGRSFYRRIVDEVAAYVLREMTDVKDGNTGAFFASQDADTEAKEGAYFVWTPEEFDRVLGEHEGHRAAAFWGVTKEGNFEEGTSVLHRLSAVEGSEYEMPKGTLDDDVERMRRKLLEARQQRVRPERDEKIIASWNGLMIEAMAFAGAALEQGQYVEAAERAADFVVEKMCTDGRARGLHRIHGRGRTRLRGCLDDYANMAVGLVALYEATGRAQWLDDARQLVEEMVERFQRPEGGFYYASQDPDLIVRHTEVQDRAMPSATARALEALHRLGIWTGDEQMHRRCAEGLRAFYPQMMRHPEAMTHMISVLDAELNGPLEVVCVRGVSKGEQKLAQAVHKSFLRHGAGVVVDADEDSGQPPVVADKTAVDEQTAAYVCQRGQCSAPVTEIEAFFEELGKNFSSLPH